MDASERTRTMGRRRDIAVAIVTVVIVLAAGFAAWQSLTTRRDQQATQQQLKALVECQAQVNAETRRAILAREKDGTDQLAAQLELVTTPPGDPERGRAALARFVVQLRQALASREANPFPTRDC